MKEKPRCEESPADLLIQMLNLLNTPPPEAKRGKSTHQMRINACADRLINRFSSTEGTNEFSESLNKLDLGVQERIALELQLAYGRKERKEKRKKIT